MNKRTKELNSSATRRLQKIWDLVTRPLNVLSENQKFWLGFGVLCVVTTLLINNPIWRSAGDYVYKEGDIARESITSPADIYFVDEEATERIRETAKETVIPNFAFESKRADEAVQNFRAAWESMQRRSPAANSNRGESNGRTDVDWPGLGGTELGRVFGARNFSSNELDSVVRILRENSSGDIYADQDGQYLANEVMIVDRQRPTESRRVQNPQMSMTALTEARERLAQQLSEIRSFSQREAEAFNSALAPLIQPSVIYDAAATENARRAIAESVQPVSVSLKRSQKIVDEGNVIDAQTLLQINAVRSYTASTRQSNRFVGLLLLIAGLFWGAWKFIEHRGIVPRLALSEHKTFALFGFIVVAQTAMMAAMFRLADFTASQNVKAPLNDPSLWAFAVPFAFSSLLMNLLADRRTALFTGVFTALLAGLLAPRGLEFVIYATIASSVSVYGIGHYRSRGTVTLAGLLVGLVSSAVALALIAYTQQPFILNTVLLAIACGLASGMITAAATAVFLPICESLFGILTDVKLLELSNADLPVLGQLALRAPGTNQHSHAVGQLAEEACRVVGANGLLSRIGALYHDIGKTAAPEHFVENQMNANPHDRLKPAQSAKIIISHVTYGVKLAREMGLPQRIIDFIPQHHGTRTLHYFLKKAQAQARPDEEFDENDFRYPGPKPQFKEAAIMMIADSCEAAARSLSEPTPENIRFIVTKIIDAILSDDQLDECDLTLRELTQIREAMIRSLVAIYHSRVDYPGYVPPASGQYKIIPEEGAREYGGMKYKDPKDIPVSRGGEIEDEAIDRSQEPGRSQAKSAD
ncbi:MAG: HDIG domain-containing protein [Chloracidobacterium sp.]|nr:HDIG domain-containing protein [Chloracidobacterium sp.]